MSCLGNNYNPVPTREWSRVQNRCIFDDPNTDNSSGTIYFAPLKKYIPITDLAESLAMIRKGNVLQYKKNSSNLTKSQRYSKIAQGAWTNRNITWATQSQSYTNPNTTHLKRVGQVNINISDGTVSLMPITCPKPINPFPSYPPVLPSNNPYTPVNVPVIPPPPPSGGGGGDVFPPIIPVAPVEPIVIPDGGNLLCNIVEDPCTGETITQPASQNCHPTTDSDVPGTIQYLCYNDSLPTYYPKTRLTMSNSTDKWPTNAKLIRSLNYTQ